MPLKTYGQSFVRGEITHSSRARDTGAFVLSVCVRTECVEREREIERGNGKRWRERSKKRRKKEPGDNIIPRLRVSVKKRITQ